MFSSLDFKIIDFCTNFTFKGLCPEKAPKGAKAGRIPRLQQKSKPLLKPVTPSKFCFSFNDMVLFVPDSAKAFFGVSAMYSRACPTLFQRNVYIFLFSIDAQLFCLSK